MPEPEVGEEPTRSILGAKYNQTYIIKAAPPDVDPNDGRREVMFKCGNWCYAGKVEFTHEVEGGEALQNVPLIIPELQRQQGKLGFYCSAVNLPPTSEYHAPLQFISAATEFVAKELTSEKICQEIDKWAKVFSWMYDDHAKTYFELTVDPASLPIYLPTSGRRDSNNDGLLRPESSSFSSMGQQREREREKWAAIVSKTYARGLVIITIYMQGSFYVVMEEGEGDQPLLDIRFPDVSQHGQGLHLATYPEVKGSPWRKVTLWQSLSAILDDSSEGRGRGPTPSTNTSASNSSSSSRSSKNGGGKGEAKVADGGGGGGSSKRKEQNVVDLSTSEYMQTYVVLKQDPGKPANDPYRDVMFRFGSWCYSGRVQLAPVIELGDLPHVIPILRMQQSSLGYSCDVGSMPRRSPYTGPMEHMMKLASIMEEEIIESEALLAKLIQRLSTMGLSENISEWLEGDGEASQSFFEFLVAHSLPSTSSSSSVAALDPYRGVELIASKSYNPQGVVTITIYFRGYYYVIIADGQTEQPLLDSKFPDVSEKGRGYQLRSYSAGVDGWPELRKVSIWQTARALKVQGEKAQAKLEEIRTAKGVDAMEAASIAQRRMEQLTMEALRSSSPSSAAAAEEKGSRPIYSPEASSSKIISSGSTSSGTPTHAVTGMTRSESGRGEKEEVILRDDDDEREEGGRGGELTTLDAGVAEAKVEAAPTAVEMKLANEVLRRGSTSDRIGEATTTTPAATAAGGGGGGGRRGSTPTSSTAINSNGVVVGGGIGMGGGGAKALQPLGGTRVALPHHLAPMQGDTSALKERLRQLQNEVGGTEGGGGAKGLLGGGLGPAPWDVRGRPLGSILLGGKGKIEDEEEGDRSAKK